MSIFVVLKKNKNYQPLKHYIMDILLQLQSIRKNKSFYIKVLDIPYNTICRFWSNSKPDNLLRLLPQVEEAFCDRYYLTGILDATFSNRKVLYTFSYSDYTGITCGLGGASSNV